MKKESGSLIIFKLFLSCGHSEVLAVDIIPSKTIEALEYLQDGVKECSTCSRISGMDTMRQVDNIDVSWTHFEKIIARNMECEIRLFYEEDQVLF